MMEMAEGVGTIDKKTDINHLNQSIVPFISTHADYKEVNCRRALNELIFTKDIMSQTAQDMSGDDFKTYAKKLLIEDGYDSATVNALE